MNPSIYQAGMNAGATGGNSGFWGSIANKLGSMGASSAQPSAASTSSGGSGGGKTSSSGKGDWSWKEAATNGLISAGLGALDGGESGTDKLNSELAHSEKVTRQFEARNTAPTAAIGNYMARAVALQGMPVLGMLNNLDFMAKVLGYGKDYYPKVFKGIGNLLGGRK